MTVIVLCLGEDGEAQVFGPFVDESWAKAWIKQHNHESWTDDPTPEVEDQRAADTDHWCINSADNHQIDALYPAGFDPTTLPERI